MTDTTIPSRLPMRQIRPGTNPRRYFDPAKHAELVQSIKLHGILQPVLVRASPNEPGDLFELVAGGRRFRAAQEALGEDGEIPVIVRFLTDQEALEAAIAENDDRDDASETEQADAALRALKACGDDRAEAARRLGWSQAKLARRLALAGLSDEVKAALDERRIKVGHAELLAAVPPEKQNTALHAILTNNMDVARTRAALQLMTQSLAHATFDRAECLTCPFNSASQQALFETHVDDGHCTNPGCYQLKHDAIEAAMVAPAAAVTTSPEPDSGAASAGQTSTGDAGATAEPSTPDSIPALADPAITPAPAQPVKPAGAKPKVTVASLAAKAREMREDEWRGAVAEIIGSDDGHAINVILLAANSGTLSQICDIPPFSLSTEAPGFAGKIAAIRALSDDKAHDALRAVAKAYVLDVRDFAHVADLARAYAVDLRQSWRVSYEFLELFDKAELTFIARECGLVAHMGEKAFAALLKNKADAIAQGMANATDFDWSGRLPSAMTLDGEYGQPPVTEPAEPAPAEIPAAPATTDSED